MATNGYYGPPGGFDLAALKVREAALTPDGARAESPKVYVSPDAPGRVANVFRRRGQWSLPWWKIADDAQEERR